jgi:hypothetical protein
MVDEDERTASLAARSGFPDASYGPAWSYEAVDARMSKAQVGPDTFGHIARWDPARVLREVEAKRRRLVRHVPERRRLTLIEESGETSLAFYVCTFCTPNLVIERGQRIVEWPCPDVRDDAGVYDDAPGYRPEWRPE